MARIIFRNDDVSPSTNFIEMYEMYAYLKDNYDCEIWSCVNLFSRGSNGSVYPELPLRGHPKNWFYDVDRIWSHPIGLHKVVSHGLIHAEHDKLSRDAQEMSILTSCKYLETNIFVPPFTAYNKETKEICEANGIIMEDDRNGWKSMEQGQFNDNHTKWFFHSWRFKPKSFRELFNNYLKGSLKGTWGLTPVPESAV